MRCAPSIPALVLSGLAAAVLPCAAAERPPAQVLVRSCAGCHGTDGVSAGTTTSSLAGQPAAYLAAVMRAFRSGERPATIMDRLARAYDDKDIEAMAAYYAGLPPARAPQQTDPARRARGASLHAALCAKCHKDGGRGFEFEGEPGPALAGQWREYLSAAIREYLARDREMPRKMGWQLLQLGAGDAEALAHFYASQD